ncbi:LysR substrate-binding domain-containing protein [Acidisphaera sp. L21]|uniref:LysR substrate-binding domain-containing protein n=1 Tax=Acidisphaera sp. L21 TaxID=1641851 RepID=UPI00131B5A1F|nr:LysR substrate-binding domain-containing protein [Acidisphaera sp. L21]
MQLDLVTLRLFIAVHEECSLTRAAEREHMSLSAVSKRISDLEKALRTVLFRRTKNRLEPLPTAQTLARHARRVLSELDELQGEFRDFAQGLKGRVRIWSNSWAIIQSLPKDLASFMADNPLVQIELQENLTPVIIQGVADNAADIGIFAGNVPAPGLHVEPYRYDRLVVVMAADHDLAVREAVRPADMVPYHVIGPKLGSGIDALFAQAGAGLNLKPRIRVAGAEAVCCMAEAGLGIGLVPEKSAQRYSHYLKIVARPFESPWSVRQINLCTGPLESLSPAGRRLLAHMRATVD